MSRILLVFSLRLGLLFSLSFMAAGGAMAETPVPLWTQAAETGLPRTTDWTGISVIKAVTPESFVITAATGGLLALDTHTGKTLWHREGHWQGTNAQNADVGKGDSWDLIGTARGNDTETVYLLQHTFSETALNPHPNAFGVPVYVRSSHFTVEGAAARSGQMVWQGIPSTGDSRRGIQARNGVLIVNGVANREYWDAATGKPIAMETSEGRVQIERILARNGGSTLENEVTFCASGNALPDWPLRWLRADTGTVEPLPLPKLLQGYIHVDLVQPLTPEGRMVLRIDMDNDAAGHSQFPKYVIGSDMQGRKLWQFPPKIEWRKDSNETVALTQVGFPLIIPGTGICLVDGCGLRVRDGKLLWKQVYSPVSVTSVCFNGGPARPAAVYKAGCFALAPDFFHNIHPNTVSVAYMTAQTGAVWPVLFGLTVYQIRVIGETLLVQTAPTTFRAYAIPALLAISR